MIKLSFNRLTTAFCAAVFGVATATPSFALTNIVANGSFEEIQAGWSFSGGLGVHQAPTAAHGNIYVSVGTELWQDLNTVPGRDYVITFAQKNDLQGQPSSPVTITWNGTTVGPWTNFASIGYIWDYLYCHVRASSNVTRLGFSGGTIDDVKVSWLQEPMQIVAQPQSRTGLEGGTVSFAVSADGAPPIGYQWQFNRQPIVGATDRSFTITPLRKMHEGTYSVVISNASGTITSQNAALQVTTPPTSPEIVAQPVGDICPAGYGCSLSVLAVGAPPLQYQWTKNGAEIPGATNRSLTFESVQTTNAGNYAVRVSNDRGTVLSLTAPLTVTNTSGGFRLFLDTQTNNAAIYDVDGTTRLAGSNFLAHVYAGPTPDILRPVGAPTTFFTGSRAGYVIAVMRQVPDVPPGQTAYIQVRAWEAAAGASYEEARAAGGKFGFSRVFNSSTDTIFGLLLMQSFSLRAGEPFFITGRLGVGDQLPGGDRQFVLTGDAGFRYLIEKRLPPHDWVPLMTVTNTTGTVTFTDPEQRDRPMQFYRARILD